MSSPRKLSAADLPPSLREELERYPAIADIANAARQISDALLAASQWDDEDGDEGGGEGDGASRPLPREHLRTRAIDGGEAAPRELPAHVEQRAKDPAQRPKT